MFLSRQEIPLCLLPVITPAGTRGSDFSHDLVLSFLEVSPFWCLMSFAQHNVSSVHPYCCMYE